MCDTCKSLESKIQRARADGNSEKERVMTTLLENHLRHNHAAAHNVVAVDQESVIWPNGVRWIVRV